MSQLPQTLLEKQQQQHCFRKVVLLMQHLTAMDSCMAALSAYCLHMKQHQNKTPALPTAIAFGSSPQSS